MATIAFIITPIHHIFNAPRSLKCRQPQHPLRTPRITCQQTTEDTFAIDAGRDLFFSAMTPETAIELLSKPSQNLSSRDDRFIAAERLKFFPSSTTTKALLSFITNSANATTLEDRVARRKAVESLGRHKGQYLLEETITILLDLLNHSDPYMVEVTVWTLSQIVSGRDDVMAAIMQVLHNPEVEKRAVIRALLSGRYKPAVDVIKQFVDVPDLATASAAMSAVAVLSGNHDVMKPVLDILKSDNLNVRRAALDDITLTKYTPALPHIAVAPNSLVLRARAVRVLLDSAERVLNEDRITLLDRLIWDHPGDLDLLGMKKETRKARDPDRNIRQLYKNDAVHAYLASRTLAEDHTNCSIIGGKVQKSYDDLGYFDYFGAYHVYKTLGWLHYTDGYDLLIDNAENLPPRFFNHQAGSITALAALGKHEAVPVINKVGRDTDIWEVKYACLLTSQRLGDQSLRDALKDDDDWLIRARARSKLDFEHLKDSFS